MPEKDVSIKILKNLLEFSEKNQEIINWGKLRKELNKFESLLKSLITPSKKVEEIFSNKKLFQNLNEIKLFMTRYFNLDIKERSTAGTLSNITYFTLKNPEAILKIETIISSKTIRQRATPKQKKIPQKKVIQPKGESWRDWTKYDPDELKIYLKSLTLAQIKPKLGKILTASEKKLRKADLIETIVKKIRKLKIHYEMGPG